MSSIRRIYHSCFVHSISLTQVEYIQNGLMAISEAGVISWFEREISIDSIDRIVREKGWQGAEIVIIKKGEFIIPGFIDTHTHAPQFPNIGFGQEFELLDWLTNCTFPSEAKFSDALHAKKIYEKVVKRVINSGTTTCCYYGTIHLTTKILASTCHNAGQRAFVGKCNMDRNSAENYTEVSADISLQDTKDFIKYVRTHCISPTPLTSYNGTLPMTLPPPPRSPIERSARSKALSETTAPRADSPSNGRLSKNMYSTTSLIQPILTPRFAISCSDELLKGLAQMMDKDENLSLQTHLAENPTEISFTKSLYPQLETYTAVYDAFKLLRKNTILAHCTHLESSELDLISKNRSGISHCPTSNFNLRSGMSSVGEMLDRGIKVSLGTDISGGFGLGILSAIRNASICSKVRAINSRDEPTSSRSSSELSVENLASLSLQIASPKKSFASDFLSLNTLFYLATLGGAAVVNLENRIGNFTVGKEFDALLIITGQGQDDENIGSPNMFVEDDDSLEKLFEKFLFTGDDRNIGSVFVRGNRIGGCLE